MCAKAQPRTARQDRGKCTGRRTRQRSVYLFAAAILTTRLLSARNCHQDESVQLEMPTNLVPHGGSNRVEVV